MAEKSVMDQLQGEALTIRDHLDPDKHWIGESLGIPTQSEIAATVGTISTPGESPFVARADHLHKLGTGFITKANMADDVLPSAHADNGNVIVTSGTVVSTISTISVPAKARIGFILYNALIRIQKSVPSDVFSIDMKDSVDGNIATVQAVQGLAFEWLTLTGWRGSTGTTARVVTLEINRISGTGTATTVSGPASNNMSVVFIPI
jgi:hypothetical protein